MFLPWANLTSMTLKTTIMMINVVLTTKITVTYMDTKVRNSCNSKSSFNKFRTPNPKVKTSELLSTKGQLKS